VVDGDTVTASFENGKLNSICPEDDTAPVYILTKNEITEFYALTSSASAHLYAAPTPTRLRAAQIRADMMND